MAACVLPSAADLQAVHTVPDLLTLLHVSDPLWAAFVHQADDPGNHVRLLAALPRPVIVQSAVQASFANGETFSAVQARQVGLVWRAARKVVHLWAELPEGEFADLHPWEPGGQVEGAAASTTAVGGQTPATPAIKEQVLV